LTIKLLPPEKISGLASRIQSDEPQKMLANTAETLSELSKFIGIVFYLNGKTWRLCTWNFSA